MKATDGIRYMTPSHAWRLARNPRVPVPPPST
ncbi:MAG: hypothetical protein BWZ08_01217 [candidate division BRC1 bacterium ADurb.BinA292]|nr:MAG: hypothetical protein BWZ08_01217 [candidate division BRC1 bacterium ADurb.BinA292]